MADPEDAPTAIPGAASDPWARHTPAQPYTIHDDAVPEPGTPRRGLDPVALLAGLAALLVAALAMTGLLVDTDPRWVLAGGAVLVGGLVLLTSLRRT